MKLQVMKGNYCLPYSASMASGVKVEEFLDYDTGLGKIEHHHIQHIIDVLYYWGFAIIPISRKPEVNVNGQLKKAYQYPEQIFKQYIVKHNAILIDDQHAVCWDSDSCKILDPIGKETTIRNWDIPTKYHTAWVLLLRSNGTYWTLGSI